MLSVRLVIDTNVVLSRRPQTRQPPADNLSYGNHQTGSPLCLAPVLKEYADVLSRRELGIRKGLCQQLLQLVKNHSHVVAPSRSLEVTSDRDDNIFY